MLQFDTVITNTSNFFQRTLKHGSVHSVQLLQRSSDQQGESLKLGKSQVSVYSLYSLLPERREISFTLQMKLILFCNFDLCSCLSLFRAGGGGRREKQG